MANVSEVVNIQKELEGSLTSKMVEFEKRLKAATTPTNPTVLQLREEFDSFKVLVSSMLSLLQQQIQECNKSVDAISMYHRRKVLLFHGLAEASEVDLKQQILQLLHKYLGLTHITDDSLKKCYRLGVQSSTRPRPILVHFNDHSTKSAIWNLKSKFKGSAISMCEFLTKFRQSIHKNARKHFGIRNVWTIDGAIYVNHSGGRTKISTEEELDDLIAKYPMDGSPESSNKAPNTKVTPKQQSSSNRQNDAARRTQTSAVTQIDDVKRSRRLVSKK